MLRWKIFCEASDILLNYQIKLAFMFMLTISVHLGRRLVSSEIFVKVQKSVNFPWWKRISNRNIYDYYTDSYFDWQQQKLGADERQDFDSYRPMCTSNIRSQLYTLASPSGRFKLGIAIFSDDISLCYNYAADSAANFLWTLHASVLVIHMSQQNWRYN